MKKSRNKILIFSIFVNCLTINCANHTHTFNTSVNKSDSCILSSHYKLSNEISFEKMASAEVGYYYIIPSGSIEIETEKYDSSFWYNSDKSFLIKHWVSHSDIPDNIFPKDNNGDIDMKKINDYYPKVVNIFNQKSKKIISGQSNELLNDKIDNYCQESDILTVTGSKGENNVVYKIIIAEVEGGTFAFVNLYIEYPKKQQNYYEPIAYYIVNSFKRN
jgi:hypothetical protein